MPKADMKKLAPTKGKDVKVGSTATKKQMAEKLEKAMEKKSKAKK